MNDFVDKIKQYNLQILRSRYFRVPQTEFLRYSRVHTNFHIHLFGAICGAVASSLPNLSLYNVIEILILVIAARAGRCRGAVVHLRTVGDFRCDFTVFNAVAELGTHLGTEFFLQLHQFKKKNSITIRQLMIRNHKPRVLPPNHHYRWASPNRV